MNFNQNFCTKQNTENPNYNMKIYLWTFIGNYTTSMLKHVKGSLTFILWYIRSKNEGKDDDITNMLSNPNPGNCLT